MNHGAALSQADPEIAALLERERVRQSTTLQLIPFVGSLLPFRALFLGGLGEAQTAAARQAYEAILAGDNISFQNIFRVGGDLQTNSLTRYQAHRLPPQEAGEHELLDLFR